MKILNKLDIFPGWKAGVLGLLGMAFQFANELLVYLGHEPLPDGLVQSANGMIMAGIALALWLKAQRA